MGDPEEDEELEQPEGAEQEEDAFSSAFAEAIDGLEDPDGDDEGDEAADPQDADEGDQEGEGDAEEGGQEGAEGSPDPRLERALTALRYDGVPSSIIKSTPQEELIAWGEKAAERRASQSRALEERAAKIRELEEQTQASTKKSTGTLRSALDDLDLSAPLASFAEELGVEKDSATKAMRPLLEAVFGAVDQAVEARLAPVQQTLERTTQSAAARTVSDNMRRLESAYPAIGSDPDKRKALLAKATALAKTGSYESEEAIFDDAATLVFGARRAARTDMPAKRRNGASRPPTRRREQTPQSWDDYFGEVVSRIESGDREGARRIPKPSSK